ncbi:hypothetical protein QKU48_gp0169 [Fadolivirus algeromassiliense]|jgi:hypothetical protein|uniref:Uncharacterized protein n=1 Tax=Fadolivirus FV1/VV64 TaxID=3070911 RepID=A0A7D3QTV2_9VIRU|nr:hypothetical protein QKU48_gp0169 [Fadolivirus algeromassiliense]QKF93627.1 hypothetical protein Fadolivirus_1_169 [Fadolivirus FV1/VV64]
MNWLQVRENITPKCENFRDFGHNDKFSKQTRNKIIMENKYSCRYCGGIYPKYLICCYIPSQKCNDVCCRICYIITHLNYGLFQEIKLYHSTMPQLDIIKKTVQYILDNNEIPSPDSIDNNIKLAPFSLLEYINLLNNYDNVPKELENYKFFVSHKMNLDFIINNYGDKMSMFIDADRVNDTDRIKIEDTLETHQLTTNELELFKILGH